MPILGDGGVERTLELLGRLEFTPSRWVGRLALPGQSDRHVRRRLTQWHQERLIWRATTSARRVPGSRGLGDVGPPIAPRIWGLTPEGRAWLLATTRPPDDPGSGLRVRAWANPDVRPAQLAHDLLASTWLAGMLHGLQARPDIAGVRAEMEYVAASDDHGQALQRFDALLQVWIGRRDAGAPDGIPWTETARPGCPSLAFALEIDRGTEKLAILLGKAAMYRALTLSGHYRATLGVDPLPVVIVPTARRAAQIAREWRDGWPGGAGVIATETAAQIAAGRPLHGQYATMTDDPPRRSSLAAGMDEIAHPNGRSAAWRELA